GIAAPGRGHDREVADSPLLHERIDVGDRHVRSKRHHLAVHDVFDQHAVSLMVPFQASFLAECQLARSTSDRRMSPADSKSRVPPGMRLSGKVTGAPAPPFFWRDSSTAEPNVRMRLSW